MAQWSDGPPWPPARSLRLGERDSVLIASSGIIAWIIVINRQPMNSVGARVYWVHSCAIWLNNNMVHEINKSGMKYG